MIHSGFFRIMTERDKRMKAQVKINDQSYEFHVGTSYEEIANQFQNEYEGLIALVTVNGKIRELIKKVEKDCELSFITLKDSIGHKTYVRSATMLMMKAIGDLFGQESVQHVKVDFVIGKGYYCSLSGELNLSEKDILAINKRMKELVDQNIPIQKKSYLVEDALKIMKSHGMKDKEKLFKYRRSSVINMYNVEDYYDYYYGFMLPSTGYIKHFSVTKYEDGIMLIIPERTHPTVVEIPAEKTQLFQTLKKATSWGIEMGIDTVGDLNDKICKGSLSDIVLVQEALQERRIGEIAKKIAERKDVKFVMIAGPSSSGKTTFSHRLSVQLRTYGLTPHPIALDDYFVNRDATPKDENGNYNFECLEALDINQFNIDMNRLLDGEEVELPTFNFKTGQREYKGNCKKLGPDDVLVLEGIHGLNDKMSYSIPVSRKFKIYISALTSLNVDEHNRIPTTDGRLLRRIVRDARTRGASAKRTIEMWPSVRRGEEENIFPFQESADEFFNSALIYELAVLKQFAEPLLFNISKSDPEYYEAKRLLKFLEYFLGVSSENLPNNSIIREFVGGSCFQV